MKFEPTPLAGLVVVRAEPHADERGWFARTYCADEFRAAGVAFVPVQMSASFNERAGTLRGMHWQRAPHGECKLVRVVRGRIHDVVVDLRVGSATRGRWFAIELSEHAADALLVPPGFAHGFLTLEDRTEILYAMDRPLVSEAATGARWDDPAFAIRWPFAPQVISQRDANWPDWPPGAA